MPDGRTHDRLTRRWILLAGTGTMLFSLPLGTTCAAGIFISGYFMGPDLDTRSLPFKRWGALRFIWEPYRVMIPHRSFLSHGPVVGTLIRLIYLSMWIGLMSIPIGFIADRWLGLPFDGRSVLSTLNWIFIEHAIYWWTALVGMEIGAATHYIADVCSTFFKRLRRKFNPFRFL